MQEEFLEWPWHEACAVIHHDAEARGEPWASADDQSRVIWRDGAGRFFEGTGRLIPDNQTTDAVAVGDVDGDGDLDIVFAGRPSRQPGRSPIGEIKLHLNDGVGFFADVSADRLPPLEIRGASVTLDDFDGDGSLDIFVGEELGTARLLLNDGTGRFRDASQRLPAIGASRFFAENVTAMDIDMDGDLDVVISRLTGPEIWVQGVDGTFSILAAGSLPAEVFNVQATLVADFDRDGDPDLLPCGVVQGTAVSNPVWFNQHRHVDAAAEPQIGRDWTLEIGHRPLAAPRLGVAFPLLSAARAVVAIEPFGILGLDAGGLIALDPVALSPSAGHTRWTLRVPALAGLVDQEVHVQLLIQDLLGAARLTNVWTATVGAAD